MPDRNNRLESAMLAIKPTETLLRLWKRRLIVAVTDSAKEQAKNMIKKYE